MSSLADSGDDDGGDATMLGVALAGSRLADSRRADRRRRRPEAAAPAVPVAAPPEWLDDDLVVETDETNRRRRRWPCALLVAVLAVLVGGGAAFAYAELARPEPHDPGPQGPHRGGGARPKPKRSGSRSSAQESREDGSTPGDVLGTRPEAGEELDEGDTLTLIVSLGNTPAPVPTDLVGKPLEEATQILADAGGFAPEVTREIDETVPKDVVIALGEGVPAELPKGSAVPLVVSSGPAPRTVPSGLVGGTFDQAKAALGGVQLKAKQVDEFSDTVEKGRVIRVDPGEGQQVAARQRRCPSSCRRGPTSCRCPT